MGNVGGYENIFRKRLLTLFLGIQKLRNFDAHEAHIVTEADITGVTYILKAMYFFIVSQETTVLEISVYFNE